MPVPAHRLSDLEREKEIVRVRRARDRRRACRAGRTGRAVDPRARSQEGPSISETIDWARTLLYLGKREISPEVIGDTLHVLLKYQSDIAKARKELVRPRVRGFLPRVAERAQRVERA